MSEVVFHNKQGQTFTPETASIAMLQWYATATNRNISSQQREAAIDALSRRGDEGTEPGGFDDQQSQKAPGSKGNSSTALAKAPDNSMQFVSSDANEINTRLATIADTCHLITPTTAFGKLPDGYEAQVTMVKIDSKDDCHEISGPNGKMLMLSASALKRVATAAGVSWDPDRTRRMDNRMQMDYWEFQAVGTIVDIDGRERNITGAYELDLREGSARERTKKSQPELDTMRKFGLSRAETGAKSRAISEMLKRSESKESGWQKPIVCVRLIARRPVAESMDALYPRTAADPPRLQQPKTIDVEPSNDPTGPDGQAV